MQATGWSCRVNQSENSSVNQSVWSWEVPSWQTSSCSMNITHSIFSAFQVCYCSKQNCIQNHLISQKHMTCVIACYFGSGGYSHYKDCQMVSYLRALCSLSVFYEMGLCYLMWVVLACLIWYGKTTSVVLAKM